MRIWVGITAGVLAIFCDFAQASPLTTIDLINTGSGAANGTLYSWSGIQPTGTGVIDPFLRVQNSSGIEEGYNTSLATNDNPWQTKAGSWTHDLHFSDLALVDIGGLGYYEFLLDINENSGGGGQDPGRYISLNDIQIFTRPDAITTVQEDLSILGTKRYGMDVGADGDVTVNLDYALNSGSGSGDMFMYILADNFVDVQADDFVYFYTLFGTPYTVDAGFEEWAIRKPDTSTCQTDCTTIVTASDSTSLITPIPAPGTLSLMGLGFAGLRLMRRKQNG